MPLRISRRRYLGRGFWVSFGKRGPSFGRRGKRFSVSRSARGTSYSVRLMKGVSWVGRRARKPRNRKR